MLHDLVRIAHDNSASQRNLLMGRISSLFADRPESYSDQELNLFGDVIARLLDNADTQARSDLAILLAPINRTPHDLLIKLAHDDILVAGHVLTHSDVLDTADLVQVASKTTIGHQVAISARPGLVQEVTDVLIKSNEREVLYGICINTSAEISDWGFDQLADCAVKDSLLRDHLCERQDITLDAIEKIMPVLSAFDQLKLISRVEGVSFDTDERVIAATETARRENGRSTTHTIQANRLILQIKSGNQKLDQVCRYLASQDRPSDLNMVIAVFSGLPEHQVSNAFAKVNGDKIAELCRTLEISTKTYTKIAGMWCKRLNLPGSHKQWIIQKYADFES